MSVNYSVIVKIPGELVTLVTEMDLTGDKHLHRHVTTSMMDYTKQQILDAMQVLNKQQRNLSENVYSRTIYPYQLCAQALNI